MEFELGIIYGFLLGLAAMASYNYIFIIKHRIKTGRYR
tara:strand:- start:893 stop:1006 length:114 start_codon:yes stop_codon:yes gene_type:complete